MLAHPNIVRVYEVLETERFLYFVQELCEGGDLVQLINARGRLSERETRQFMRQLLAAVDHCHRAGILHRCALHRSGHPAHSRLANDACGPVALRSGLYCAVCAVLAGT